MIPSLGDPRIYSLQCVSLKPVEKLHQNPWFSVFSRGGYFTIEDNKPQVIVLPILENSSVIMVRVCRPVIADDTLELPAGGMRENESPVEAAIRELSEETGIHIADVNRFCVQEPMVLTTRNPYFPRIFQINLTQKEFRRRLKHDTEIISVECFSFKEALEKIRNNEIYSSFHIALLIRFLIQNKYLVCSNLRRNKRQLENREI